MKTTTILNNVAWNTPQFKTVQKSDETQIDLALDTPQRTRVHEFKISKTANIICREICEPSWDQMYYLDSCLLIKGYQMGESLVLGRLLECCK